MEQAKSVGLDLVEVGPNQNPPVCRLLDYGRFKFIQSKKQREARKVSRSASKQKDVRLSPVMSDNDIETKMDAKRLKTCPEIAPKTSPRKGSKPMQNH